ncbi:hypothetical protein [Brunnivagina elsteri]|uniref:Uncharacterized protein n=1 Tax=Brunnivagina elsteri CCALA 953 TaxID=987040 RepID=A0A2A2TG92_9CYAN|nr:hypothetical protein [Calothrix elsteri]PAX52665.1 hypothetical protein CK510_18075 [Calothrix elsteri CCALA 953]
MHKYIYLFANFLRHLVSSRQWRFPLLGLVLVLGVVANRSQPVFSNQMDNDPYSYRVTLPDSGATLETWRETETASTVPESEGMASAPPLTLLPGELDKQPIITALVPKAQQPIMGLGAAKDNQFAQQDGIYLYGQSPKPAQLGQGYVVFEKRDGKVTGAMYLPDSEYSCFNGTLDKSGELAMTVNGYPGEVNSTQVAYNESVPRINSDEPVSYAYSLALRDFYRLNTVGNVDRDILKACQQGSDREQ